jgi:hypothetical protein
MNKLLLVLFIFIPSFSFAQLTRKAQAQSTVEQMVIGWELSHLTAFYGGAISPDGLSPHHWELQYDRGFMGCLAHHWMHGLGLNFNQNDEFAEYGLKAILNPFRAYSFRPITMRTRLYPYLFFQVNRKQIHHQPVESSDFNYRPGIGLMSNTGTGNLRKGNPFDLRLAAQIGYTIGDDLAIRKSGFVLELKVGIALDTSAIRSQRDE